MKRTLAVLLILAGLGAYVYFVEVKGKAEKEAAEKEAAKLFDFIKSNVVTIEVVNEHGRIVLHQQDDLWMMSEPVSAPADETAVNSLLTSLLNAETKDKIEGAQDLAAFGLDNPKIVVTLSTKKESALVRIGKRSPVSSNLYIQRQEGGPVLTTTAGIDTTANKKPEEFREKKLFTMSADDVTAITVREGKAVMEVARNGEDWRVVAPQQQEADDGLARGMAQDFVNLRATAFMVENATPADLAKNGFKPAQATVEVTLTNGAKHAIQFGNTTGGDRVAMVVGRPQIVKLADWSAKNVLKTPVDLRDRQLIKATEDQVAKLVFRTGKDAITLTKGEEGWSVAGAGVSGVAPAEKVHELIEALVGLRANEWKPSTKATLAQHGLASPERRLEVFDAAGKSLGQLAFGNEEDSWAVWAQTTDKSVEAKMPNDFVRNKWPTAESLFSKEQAAPQE